MPGGLLNLVGEGNQNVILNSNPQKTFFKSTFSKYTNFGLQKFRIDYNGLRTLRMNEPSHFDFKIPRYGDLLMDTYLVVNIPHIWSPLYKETATPYEFKWVRDLGTQLIQEVEVRCDGLTIQKYSGDYITAMFKRDDVGKTNLFDEMTCNTSEFNNPADYWTYPGIMDVSYNTYPTALYDVSGAEPSIRGRNVYVPIGAWFCSNSTNALPLIALQYNEVHIHITLRPVRELFTITDASGVRSQPNFNVESNQFHNFLQTPPNESGTFQDSQKRTDWNADVHLLSTYAFLSENERRYFASDTHQYLFKDAKEHIFKNVVGSGKVEIKSTGAISSYTFFFRRSDANTRNEWSNYTNWDFTSFPQPLVADAHNKLFYTGTYTPKNEKNILHTLALSVDGKYRENMFDVGVYEYVEKYMRTLTRLPHNGLYVYSLGINNNLTSQPSGAMNMSKFNNIQFEFTTTIPPKDPNATFYSICDDNGDFIGISKPAYQIYMYTYDLHIFEEQYNVLEFKSGHCGLLFAK